MSRAVFDQGLPPRCPQPFNMAAHVLARATEEPDKIALIIAGETPQNFTFAQITARVLGFGGALLARGLRPGARILLRLGNTADFPLSYLGALSVGMVPVPTSPMLTEAEVAYMIRELAPDLILQAPDIPCPADPRIVPASQVADMQRHAPASWHLGDANRLGYIVYTSGTSGQPRAVAHAHRAIWARRMMHADWYDLKPDDRMLHAGAFNWTFTLGTGLMDPWTLGATAIVPAPGTPIDTLPELLRDYAASLFAAAPGVFRKLLSSHDTLDLPALRHALSAGEKMPPHIARRWTSATGTNIFEAYGQSEVSTFISASPTHPARPGVLGRPQRGRKVALTDPDGTPVAFGEPGQIRVHRSDPGLMLGYLNETPVTDGPEWYDTGDRGIMCADGQITYLGRDDDMMNAGGYRVSPLEVEAALGGLSGLGAVAVTEVATKSGAKIIVAFYTAPHAIDEAHLHDHATARLAGYKCPRAYVHIDALPTGANGKLSRKALVQYWTAK